MNASISSTKNTTTSGFSLFELLTFVAIIGIMASMVIPFFGNQDQIQQATAKRNAQSFCTLANSASAAGNNVTVGVISVEDAFKRLAKGITITRGSFKGSVFKLPSMNEQEIKNASAFAKIENGELIYLPHSPAVLSL